MKTNPNDPINPIKETIYSGHGGLTKLEHFAGLAMQGILSAIYTDNKTLSAIDDCAKLNNIKSVAYLSNLAIEHAKSLIEELNKSES
jgi:hypothetical protein